MTVFPTHAFCVREVQFSNGTTGRGLFANQDVEPCVLPYVCVVQKKTSQNLAYGVEAQYMNKRGDCITHKKFVLNGDPAMLTAANMPDSDTFASMINEPDSAKDMPNSVLHVNPLLSRLSLETAYLTQSPIIGNFVVTDSLKKDDQLLLRYGPLYSRNYAAWQATEENKIAYDALVERSCVTLDVFLQNHSHQCRLTR
jgi:hypothetical protein